MTENKLPIQYRPTTINLCKGFEIMIGNTPILGTTLGGVMGLVNAKIAEDKIKYLIERLNNSEINFEEISKCDSSLWNMIQVFNCIIRINQKKKIDYLFNLVVNGYNKKIIFEDNDFFEEYIKILERVTIEDIVIMECLKENYTPIDEKEETPKKIHSQLKHTIDMISSNISKSEQYVISILDKLVGYGLCSKIIYQSFSFGVCKTDVEYKISPIYEKLSSLIINNHSIY